ncbi:MAG: carbohydrate kinase family protein [Patescibacteria group bacterium]
MTAMKKKSSYKYDIISIGDATLNSFLKLDDASLLCSSDHDHCWLCLSYADKIPVKEMRFTVGGNACNNAVGSARLGLKTAFYSVIGDDDNGKRILKDIRDEGVSPEYLIIQKRSTSNYAVVLNFHTERTILGYHHPRSYTLPKFARAKWIYLTSMGKGFEKIHTQLLLQLRLNGTQLAFNPGTLQLRAGIQKLKHVLKLCSVLIVNKEEAGRLLGKELGSDLTSGLKDLHAAGPEIVVITDGPKGAYGFNGHEHFYTKPLPSRVLERTGAGDAFSTGLLAAFCHGKPLSDALLWGAANSASVIEHVGPQKGLLTKSQLEKRIRTCKGKCTTIG